MSGWLTPLNKLKIRKAVYNRKPTLKLDDNRELLLTYNEETQVVYIKPKYGLVPQGYFRISQIMNDHEWLSETIK